METIKIYAILDRVEQDKGYFRLVPREFLTETNNFTNIENPDNIDKEAARITSFHKEGVKAGTMKEPINVPGLSWAYNADGTRTVKLDKANLSKRKLSSGKFYVIEVDKAFAEKKSQIALPLVERKGRISIYPLERLSVEAPRKSDRKPLEKTRSTKGFETKLVTDNLNNLYKSTKYDLEKELNKVKLDLSKSGYQFTVGSIAPPVVEDLLDTDDPLRPPKNTYIIPIELPLDEDEFRKPESFMRIGYTKLLIGPQSINVRTDSGLDSLDLIRNQGSIKAIDFNNITTVEINFTAVGEKQYNEVVIPLIQQSNKTPFLPITNLYMNSTLDIDAIAVKDIQISSIDGVPGAVSVRIIAEPFLWEYYLPENESFEDGFCWPLFKAWCESDSKHCRVPKRINEIPNGRVVFTVPREDLLTSRKPNYNELGGARLPEGTTEVLDSDSLLAVTAIESMKLGNNVKVKNEDGEVLVFWLEGQPYSLIRFNAARNIIKALEDPSIKAYSYYTSKEDLESIEKNKHYQKISFFPEGGLDVAYKREIAEAIGRESNIGEQGENQSITGSPYFLIPRNSSIWGYIIRKIDKVEKEEITAAEMNEFQLSPNSVISNISLQFSNRLSSHQVQQSTYPKHQFLGSGDAFVSMQGTLYGQEDVDLLKTIIEEVRRLARQARPRPFTIPYAGFLGIQNNIVNGLGLNEFIPISLTINTVDGFPNLFGFQLDLVEFRQSQRDSEKFEEMQQYLFNYSERVGEDKKLYNDFTIRDIKFQNVAEPPKMKYWRAAWDEVSLRMFELYPDMGLPTKKELDRWIFLLKDFYKHGNLPKGESDRRTLLGMTKVIPKDKDVISNIFQLKESGDKLGYPDPDFYFVSQSDPKEFTKKFIESQIGEGQAASVLVYDQFGAKYYLAPGKLWGDPELPNNLITADDLKFRETQIKSLNEFKNSVIVSSTQGIEVRNSSLNTLDTRDTSILASPESVLRYSNLINAYRKDKERKTGVQAHRKFIEDGNYLGFVKEAIQLNSDVKDLHESLIMAIIARESDGDASATTPAGNTSYVGLMQLNIENDVRDPQAKARLQEKGLNRPYTTSDLRDPRTNILIGVTRIAGYLKKYKGNYSKALIAHRAGEGNVAKGNITPTYTSYVADILELASYYNGRVSFEKTNVFNNKYQQLVETGVPLDIAKRIADQISKGIIKSTQVFRITQEPYNTNQVPEYLATDGLLLGESSANEVVPNKQGLHEEVKYQVFTEKMNFAKKSWELAGGITYTAKLVPGSVRSTDSKDKRLYSYTTSSVPYLYGSNSTVENMLESEIKETTVDLTKKVDHGRLLGAFPTYFVGVIDGGRWIGVERLYDHTYGGFGVASIDVVQSRKDPVDVATVTFSNFYGRLTAQASYLEQQRKVDSRSIYTFEAIIKNQSFSSTVTKELEQKWAQWSRLTMIRPGARLHIRLGYGSNVNDLPVKFNGVISEVPVADKVCQVIALGDGIELIKKFPENDGHMVLDQAIQTAREDKMYQNMGTGLGFGLFTGKEPRNIILELFEASNIFVAGLSSGRYMSENPYGIVHFGSVDFSNSYSLFGLLDISLNGMEEIGVNVYSSKQDPDNVTNQWGNYLTLTGMRAHLNGQTLIGVQVEDASPWKVIETCRMALPDFICAVRPFGKRSTLFFGKSYFPFHYKYKQGGHLNYAKQKEKDIQDLKIGDNTISTVEKLNKIVVDIDKEREFLGLRTAVVLGMIEETSDKQKIQQYNSKIEEFKKRLLALNKDKAKILNEVNKLQQEKAKLTNNITDELESSKYLKNFNDTFLEKKAFSQYHIICSNYNLITSNIIADSTNVFTNCQSKYIFGGMTLGGTQSSIKQGNLMRADSDIYPESQRTLIKDSGLLSGPLYGFGEILGKDIGVATAANTSSVMEIRDSLADMYQGYAVIAGDPFINPWDLVYFLDGNTLMNGMFQVKEVVNHFSIESGYVTTVSPDCLVTAASSREAAWWTSLQHVGAAFVNYKVWTAAGGAIIRKLSGNAIKLDLLSAISKSKQLQKVSGKSSEEIMKTYAAIKKKLSYANAKDYLLNDFELEIQISNLKVVSTTAAKKLINRLEANALGSKALDVLALGLHTGESIKNTKAVQKILETVPKAKEAFGLLKSNINSRSSFFAKTGIGLGGAILKLAVMVLTSCIGDMIGRYLASRQCVVIFPLRIGNLEFTAGIEGHKGAVVGDEIGVADSFLAFFFSSSYGTKNFGLLGGIIPFILDFLLPGSDSGWDPSNQTSLSNLNFSTNPVRAEDSFKAFIERIKGEKENSYPQSRNTGVSSAQVDQNLLRLGKELQGVPYVWGGKSPKTGLDCSGFVCVILKKLGKNVSASARELYTQATKITRSQLRPGDLVFRIRESGTDHVGIYIGGNQVMHAANSRRDVVLDDTLEKFGPLQYGRIQ